MSAPLVTSTATMTCSFGLAPGTLSVLPDKQVFVEGKPLATVLDSVGNVNVSPFGLCTSLLNPAVASATSAAMGVLTPQPCTPIPVPWTPGSPLVTVSGTPALNLPCTTSCSFGGLIMIANAGATRTMA